MTTPTTFAIGDIVEVLPESPESVLFLGRQGRLEIRDWMSVSPGRQEVVGHHQSVRIGIVSEDYMTNWMSGGHFRLLSRG